MIEAKKWKKKCVMTLKGSQTIATVKCQKCLNSSEEN